MIPGLESPVTPLREAADALTKFLAAEKEILLLKAEVRGAREIKRLILAVVSLVVFSTLLTLTFFWITVGLHELGWSAWTLAVLTFAFFGFITAMLVRAAVRLGKGHTGDSTLEENYDDTRFGSGNSAKTA